MPRSVARVSVRPNLATECAEAKDLEGLTYTVSLGAWYIPADLIPREILTLEFFAALNRKGEIGFIGYSGPLAAFAYHQQRCDRKHNKGSVRTLHRSLAGLVKKGYLERHTPRRAGEWRQYGPEPGNGARDPIAHYSLTEKALRIWQGIPPKLEVIEGGTGVTASESGSEPSTAVARMGDTSSACLERSPAITSRTTGARGSVEQDHNRDPETYIFPQLTTCQSDDRPSPSNNPPNGDPTLASLAPDLLGSCSTEPRAPVVLEVIAGERSRHAEEVSPIRATAVDGSLPLACLEGGKRKPRAKRRDGLRVKAARSSAPRKERVNAVLYTLQIVGKQKKHARWVIARATFELADPRPETWASGVPWDHWIARWPDMTRAEKEFHARASIWPVLETRPAEFEPRELAGAQNALEPANSGPAAIDTAKTRREIKAQVEAARARLAAQVESGEMTPEEARALLEMHEAALWRKR